MVTSALAAGGGGWVLDRCLGASKVEVGVGVRVRVRVLGLGVRVRIGEG